MNEQILAVRRERYRDALEEAVQRIVTMLAQKPEVERAILFGSYAHGRRDLFTDLDVLIVMDSALDFISRTAKMYRDLCCPVDMALLVYTPEELACNRDRGFIRRVLEEGLRWLR